MTNITTNQSKLKTITASTLIAGITGAIIGIIFFIYIYGVHRLDPCYDDWLLVGGDLTQHYVGWEFFRDTEWRFPLGLLEGLTPEPVSIVFTDSIPLFAIFFKMFSPLLPETFQYFGLWGIMCFALQGALSAILINKFSKNIFISGLSSVFFVISPIVLQRMFSHTSLAGNWIITLAFVLCAYHKRLNTNTKRTLAWALLAVIASAVHIYYDFMIFVVLAGFLLYDLIKTKKIFRQIITFGVSAVSGLLVLFMLGAFYGNKSYTEYGFGVYTSNLNTLINSGSDNNSFFLKPLDVVDPAQYEGFGYMGFGMMLAGLSAAVILIINIIRNKDFFKTQFKEHLSFIICTFLVFAVAAIFATSNVVTLNAKKLFIIQLPQRFIELMGTFRASGRFIWLSMYICFFIFLVCIIRYSNKKIAAAVIGICMIFQVVDLKLWTSALHVSTLNKVEYTSPLQDEKWDEFSDKYDNIVFLPLPPDYFTNTTMYYAFAVYAHENKMSLGSFYLARSNYECVRGFADKHIALINSGSCDPSSIYIFTDESTIPEKNDLQIYKLDGYTVGVKKQSAQAAKTK